MWKDHRKELDDSGDMQSDSACMGSLKQLIARHNTIKTMISSYEILFKSKIGLGKLIDIVEAVGTEHGSIQGKATRPDPNANPRPKSNPTTNPNGDNKTKNVLAVDTMISKTNCDAWV